MFYSCLPKENNVLNKKDAQSLYNSFLFKMIIDKLERNKSKKMFVFILCYECPVAFSAV